MKNNDWLGFMLFALVVLNLVMAFSSLSYVLVNIYGY